MNGKKLFILHQELFKVEQELIEVKHLISTTGIGIGLATKEAEWLHEGKWEIWFILIE